MKKEKQLVANLNILDGIITYDGFNIEEDDLHEERWDSYSEDILQIEYGNRFVLDVGWYPESDPKGFFIVRAIVDYDWANPLSIIKCRTVAKLKIAIEKTVILIDKTRKTM